MPALLPVIGRTQAEAEDSFARLQSLIDPLVGLAHIYAEMGDLSGYPLDGPVPEPKDPSLRSIAWDWWRKARAENMTIRQLYMTRSVGVGFRLVGTAAQAADMIEEWVEAGAADGFNITPTHLPQGIDDFVALVVPELQRRGLFRTEYEGNTLRQNLGLQPLPGAQAACRAS